MDMDYLSEEFNEEEYDALNDQTFGTGLLDNDWEEDHEKYAECVDNESPAAKNTAENIDQFSNKSVIRRDSLVDMDNDCRIEQSISQLMLEFDMDDPAIMGISKTKPLPVSTQIFAATSSPPPPAILESDHVGSPSTNSIWSTPHVMNKVVGGNAYVTAVLNSFSNLSPPLVDLRSEDPSIVAAAKNVNSSLNPPTPPKLIANVRTVEEIERDLFLDLQQNHIKTKPKTLMHTEVEREILLKPSVRSVSEIENENANASGSPAVTRVIRPPPGLANGGLMSSFPGGKNDGVRMMHPILHSVTSPLTIRGRGRSMMGSNTGVTVSPPLLSPSPPMLMPLSQQSPPAFNLPSSYTSSGPIQATRMIPPQLTAFHRHPYLKHVPSGHQTVFLGQLRYPSPGVMGPTRQIVPFGPPNSIHSSRLPGHFNDQRGGIRRFTHSGQPLINRGSQVQSRLQQKRNSWSEPGSLNMHGYPVHYNNGYGSYSRECSGAEVDEYANLMSERDKNWLIKVQLMQLQTVNPYLDDYYYTTFMLKKRNKLSKENAPTLVIPERSKSESKTYQPAQFEGSLGKLQVLSVNCPRKMIDVNVVHQEDGETEDHKISTKEIKKFRQILFEIEKLYSKLLETDDLDKMAAALPETARCPLFDKMAQIIEAIYTSLVGRGNDNFIQIMSVRKGRNLLLRAVSLFSKTQIDSVVESLLSTLGIILKKDQQDPVLPRLWPKVSISLASSCYTRIVELGLRMLHQSSHVTFHMHVSPQKNQMIAVLSHKVGLMILGDLSKRMEELHQRGDVPEEESSQSSWSKVIFPMVDIFCSIPETSLPKPVCGLEHLVDHLCRYSVDNTKLASVRQRISYISGSPQSFSIVT